MLKNIYKIKNEMDCSGQVKLSILLEIYVDNKSKLKLGQIPWHVILTTLILSNKGVVSYVVISRITSYLTCSYINDGKWNVNQFF